MSADNTVESRLAQLVAVLGAGVIADQLKSLSDLTDVDNNLSPQNRNILRYDSLAALWKAEALDDIVATSVRTGTSAGNILTLQAYDTDALSYTVFGTLTAGTVPAMVLSGAVTGTTQSPSDNTTKLATTAYADAAAAGGGATRELDNLTTVAINTNLVSDTDLTDDLGLPGLRWDNTYTGTIRTGTADTNTLLLQARDVDGSSWTTFGTLTAANAPSFLLSGDVTGVTQTAADNSTKLATTAYADDAGAGGGATTALSNLAAVAINLSLTSDTDVTDDLGTDAIRWNNIYGAALRTGDSAADTLLFQAGDTAAGWTTFMTMTANVTPTMAIASDVTGVTQSSSDNSTKLATTAYADAAGAGGGATTALDNLASVAINLSLTSDTDIADDLGTEALRWRDIYAATAGTGQTATDTFKLRGYDTDAPGYIDILTITANPTVTADLNALTTIGGNAIIDSTITTLSSLVSIGTITTGTWQGTTIAVNQGGTGQTTYTNGQLLIGNTTGNTLTKAALTSGVGVTIVNSTGSITLNSEDGEIDHNNLLNYVSGEHFLQSAITTTGVIASGTWNAGVIPILYGGSGQASQQAAIDALTAVSGATNEHVLTKDTGSGNAVWKVSTGGGGATTELDNLGTVAINTSLVSDTDIIDDLGTEAFRWRDIYVATAGTGQTPADTFKLRGYDTDAPGFIDILTITANTDVTADLNAITTIGGNTIVDDTVTTLSSLVSIGTVTTGTWQGTTVAVDQGGTGQTTYTNGQLLIGNTTGNTLTKAVLTAGVGVDVTNGTGTITLDSNDGEIDHDSLLNFDTNEHFLQSAITTVGTITVGAWQSTTDVEVDYGGTGRSLATAYAVICGGITDTGAHQSIAALGSSGNVLTSNGAGALPTFQAAAGGGNVSNFGTPLVNEIAVWRSATVIEGDASFKWDGTTFTASGTTIDAGGIEIATGDTYAINAVDVLTATTLHANVQVPVNSLAGGTNATSSTFWRGDGAWETPAGGGTVTSSGSPLVNEIAVFSTATNILSDSTLSWDGTTFQATDTTIDIGGVDVATGDSYAINSVDMLTVDTLGSTVVTSSLTTVGTIGTGIWEGTTIAVNQGGTGDTTYTNGQLLIGNTTGNTLAKATLTEGNGITVTNGTGTITVAADVASTGTPANNYVALFTDANTITGTNSFLWNDTDFFIRNTAVDANPSIRIGNDSVDELQIQVTYGSGTNEVDTVQLTARSSSAVADKGRFLFVVDDTQRFIIDDGGANMPTGNTYSINDLPVLSSTGLGSSVVSSSLTSVGIITSGTWEGTEVAVNQGGSGRISAVAYSVLCGGVTTSADHQSVAALGTSGQVLTSGGPAVLPTWTTPAGSGTVTSSGSPLVNEIAVFSTATNILSDSTFTWNGTTFQATDTTIDAGGVDVATGDTYAINNVDMLTVDTLGSTVLTSSLTTVGTIGTGTWQGSVITDTYLQDTSLTQQGVVELATATEINTGTDTTRAIGVDEYQASNRNVRYVNVRVIEAAIDVTTGTAVGGDFEVPFAGIVELQGTSGLVAFTDTAGVGGDMTVDINKNGTGTSVLSTKITINTTEKSSSDATTPPAIDSANDDLVAGDILTIDVDGIHSTTAAKGLTVRIPIRRT